MLTRVLLKHFASTTLLLLGLATAVAFFVLGEAAAQAVLAAGLVASLNGAGLIWVVGVLIDPRGSTSGKATVLVVLLGKLALTLGLLYWLFAIKGMHQIGMVVGIGVAVLGLVLGVNRGSVSPEGRAAIAETEKEIAQEMEDNGDDSL